jgi:hypothetical protein
MTQGMKEHFQGSEHLPPRQASDLPPLKDIGAPGAPAGPGGKSRRRSGRLPQEALMSNLGLVLDLSGGGMCVLTRSPPKGVVQVTLEGHPLPGPLYATVTWSKRVGLFMRELGLRFESVTPETSQVLTQIASMHRYRRVI